MSWSNAPTLLVDEGRVGVGVASMAGEHAKRESVSAMRPMRVRGLGR